LVEKEARGLRRLVAVFVEANLEVSVLQALQSLARPSASNVSTSIED